jgi:glucan phosphoethanolaminetransferase (alkaline phosphatase superfamily)
MTNYTRGTAVSVPCLLPPAKENQFLQSNQNKTDNVFHVECKLDYENREQV